MIDIKFVREFPQQFDAALASRKLAPRSADIIALDESLRENMTVVQTLQFRRNEIAKNIGQVKSQGGDASQLLIEADEIKTRIPALEKEMEAQKAALDDILVRLPNIPAADVAVALDETGNIEVRRFAEPKKFDFAPKEHYVLGEELGLMDFEQTAKISGSRFTTLKGGLARMERALINFMLDIHTKEFGFMEVCPPALVKANAMFGTGQLPNLEEDAFKTTNDYYLIPTSEVSLTNLVADTIVAEEKLPIRYTAFSPCFRSEAGSAGKDTSGMLRQHQFSKVEMVVISSEKDSVEEHERMTKAAETILQRLNLPYRVMALCTGDMGFASRKTYDLEVWLPGQDKYREISSCSNCGDFQARRLKARYRAMKDQKNHLVHTLNGSGLAIGRTIIAIMENYQNADGSISIPENLKPYMGGIEKITKE